MTGRMPDLQSASCPVCGHHWAVSFFDGGLQPLATLSWPRSASQAQSMARHRLDFLRCPACGHVWNRAFRYGDIPYANHPNLMFNAGAIWRLHLTELAEQVLATLPDNPVVIEIGCGNGHFLEALAERRPGRYIGLDPHGSVGSNSKFAFEQRFFVPTDDMLHFSPHLIVMRHVLEHFEEPARFLEQVAWSAVHVEHPVWFLAETPCIDRVFSTGRLADFFYEHPQQFSTSSFEVLMRRAGRIERLVRAYDDEVVIALVQLGIAPACQARAEASARFAEHSVHARDHIARQLDELAKSGTRVALWGGTGKAAAFMHFYGVDAARFPLVVDSDPQKAGTYVPGAGQRIEFRDVLKDQPTDVVIIPTQWRAADIVAEMRREGIVAKRILIEHEGRLVDFVRETHP